MYRKLYPPNAFTYVNHCHASNTQLHEATSDETHRPVRATSHGLLAASAACVLKTASGQAQGLQGPVLLQAGSEATCNSLRICHIRTEHQHLLSWAMSPQCRLSSFLKFPVQNSSHGMPVGWRMLNEMTAVTRNFNAQRSGVCEASAHRKGRIPVFNAKGQFVLSSQASRVGECCNNSPMCWKPLVFNPVRGINKPQSTCWRLELWNTSDQFTSNVKWPARLASFELTNTNERRHLYSRQPKVGKWTENGLRTPYSSMCFNRVSQCLTDNISHMMPLPKLLKDWWFTVLEDY